MRLAVEGRGLDVDVLRTVVHGLDRQHLAVRHRQPDRTEQRAADRIFAHCGRDRIEAERREDVPGRSLAIVLVPGIAVRRRGVELLEHVADVVLRLPRRTCPVIEIGHVLDRLIAMGILAHVDDLHLADLVDHLAVIAVVEDRRRHENRVEPVDELLVAAHQIDQPLHVLHHRPAVVHRIPFGEGVAPLVRVEGRGPAAVLVAAAHPSALRVEQLAIVLRLLRVPPGILGLAERLRQSRQREVGGRIFERPGSIFVDAHVVRHIAEAVVVFDTLAADGAHDIPALVPRPSFGRGRVLDHRLVQRLHVEAAHAVQIGVGDQVRRVRPDHHVAMAGARPFGKPAGLLVGVDQPLHDLAVALRIHQREPGEDRAPGVPEAVVGVEHAVVHLAVIGAVVDRLAGGVGLVEHARELQHPPERRIEGAAVVDVRVAHLDAAQFLLPDLPRLGLGLVVAVAADLALQVAHRLFRADEGGGDLHAHLLARARLEAHHRPDMIALARAIRGHLAVVVPGAGDGEIMVEFGHEVVVEVVGHAAVVVADIPRDPALHRIDLDHRPAVVGVEDDVGVVRLRKGEAELRRALGRRHLRRHVIVGQIDLVAIRPAVLRLVAEPGGALLFLDLQRPRLREQREGGIVVHPGAGLMGLLDAVDLVRGVGVAPAAPHLARDGRPEVHAPRHGHRRIGVAIGQFIAGIAAHQRIDQVDQRLGRRRAVLRHGRHRPGHRSGNQGGRREQRRGGAPQRFGDGVGHGLSPGCRTAGVRSPA